jgi:hypothetical protein
MRSAAGDTIRTDWRNVFMDPKDVGGPLAPTAVKDE